MPIVFITGYGTVPMSVRAMKEGAVDFLQKPFNDKELLAGIERALARDRVARAARLERAVVQLRFDALTPRERQVLSLVVRGLPNKQIANELGAAEKTVKIHRGRMMHKMAAGSVAALVVMAQKIDQGPPG
jgi:FixJ family two-component response regulator